MLDTFTWVVILLPLGCYFLVVGSLAGRSRPLVVSGVRDQFTLGLGCIGLFLAGPFSLFFPQSAFNLLGGWVWLVLIMLYLLLLTLITMGQRPRLVIYSSNSGQIVQQVQQIINRLDPDSTWANAAFHSPLLQIEGNIELRNGDSTAQIVATSRQQNLSNWTYLQHELNQEFLQNARVLPTMNTWIAVGGVLLIAVFSLVFVRPSETLAAMREILRF
jgi:hypothetical protein